MTDEYTPMLQHFLEVKNQYSDTIVLYRMGDFYETFFEDAIIASRELEITLTSRDAGQKRRVPMAGIPYHALESYLPRLINKGYKVAICEQVELPSKSKKLVKREVVRVITPGTILEPSLLNEKQNNYLGAITGNQDSYGLGYVDISTGEFKVTQITGNNCKDILINELNRLNLSECLLPTNDTWKKKDVKQTEWADIIPDKTLVTWQIDLMFDPQMSRKRIKEHFKISSLEGFGCENMPLAIGAAGAIIQYVTNTQKTMLNQFNVIKTYQISDYMILDYNTRKNLELLQTVRDNSLKGSLLWVLDQTITAMGGRLIKQWITHPLVNINHIIKRQQTVHYFVENNNIRFDVREILSDIKDIERLATKIATGSSNGRDLKAISHSINILPKLALILSNQELELSLFNKLYNIPDELLKSALEIDKTLVENPPISIKDGNLIAYGINKDLDDLRDILKDDKSWLEKLEQKEKERTGIKSLKVGFSKTFGYFIEVSHANRDLVPPDYQRKQTLVNAERYITPELKEREAAILNAEEKIKILEYEIFTELRTRLNKIVPILQEIANQIATLDVITSLAEVAVRNNYCQPIITDQPVIEIVSGRHPVIEQILPAGSFVPNDTFINTTDNQLIILTGPNMAGKSTYMRQIALISIMAQIGSFIPASKATIGIVDRLFTRVGAVDDIATGQSTFMVEMNETANILNNATRKSLILLDEIGRGTSTYDGVSIAWSVSEYLATNIKARTIFATHYHELTALAETLPSVKNYQVAVQETSDRVIFLHKVVHGGANRSYGIEVARLAGLPSEVLDRAKIIMSDIERRSRIQAGLLKKVSKPKDENIQLVLFPEVDS